MTQKEINLVFKMGIIIFDYPIFRKKNKCTKKAVRIWIAKQLAHHGIYTIPSIEISTKEKMMILVSKEQYDEFHNPKEEDNETR